MLEKKKYMLNCSYEQTKQKHALTNQFHNSSKTFKKYNSGVNKTFPKNINLFIFGFPSYQEYSNRLLKCINFSCNIENKKIIYMILNSNIG